MAVVLLTNENFVKGLTNISDNLASKYLVASIREAQDMGLTSILGTNLTKALTDLVARNAIDTPPYTAYKELLDKAQYYIAYKAIAELVVKVSYKIANAGVVKTSDENVINASEGEVMRQRGYYESKADFYANELQRFVCANASAYPELRASDLGKIKANLRSSASCGIFLGGARGVNR